VRRSARSCRPRSGSRRSAPRPPTRAKREASLLTELEAIDKRLTDKRRQVAVLDARVKRAQTEIGDLQRDIARLEIQRAGRKTASPATPGMYRLQAQGGALPLLLSGDDPVAQSVRLRHLTTLATVDARMIREYRVTSEGLADRKARLEQSRRELSTVRPRRKRSAPRPTRGGQSGGSSWPGSKTNGFYHDRMVGELSEATRRLEAFIRDLQEKRRVARIPPPSVKPPKAVPGESTPGVGLGAMRGRLAWPPRAGWSRSTARESIRGRTKTFRNGIDIDAAEGSSVHAVYPATCSTRDGSGGTATS